MLFLEFFTDSTKEVETQYVFYWQAASNKAPKDAI